MSAALFALLHSINLFTGQALLNTSIQLIYTFFFGICMYLALRVTRTLLAPVLLHASTDPSIFMNAAHPSPGPFTALANLGSFAIIFVGLVLLIVLIAQRGAGSRPIVIT